MNKERLYSSLPIFLQNLACSYVGWRINRWRYNSDFWRTLNEFEKRSFASVEEINRYQAFRLHAFLQAASTNTFYRDRLKVALGSDSFSSISSLPVLFKENVQDNLQRIVSGKRSDKTKTCHTSGTTGAGLVFPSTLSGLHEQWAVWWRYRRWHGIPFNEHCGYFGGRSIVPLSQQNPPYWRHNRAANQLLFSAYHMSERNLGHYVDAINKFRPAWIHGYPSSIALLARYIVQTRRRLAYRPKWITTGAENLMEDQRRAILSAFECTPRQHYGMAEAVANCSECTEGRLHIDEDFSLVELLPTAEMGTYRLIGTNFTNSAFPLIRYDTGDLVRYSDRSCRCGRPGRIIDSIDGRAEDYVELTNGAKVGRLDHIFKDLINVREAQIVQFKPGALIMRIVRGPAYSPADESLLLSESRSRLGDGIEINIQYVDSIPKSQNGKLRFVVRKEGKSE